MEPDPLISATVKEGKDAHGSLGEGDATIDLRNLGVGLSRNIAALDLARCFLGKPGDQSVPSFLPNTMGGTGEVIVSCCTDGDDANETDCQNAWLRPVLTS